MKRPGLIFLLLFSTFSYYQWYFRPETSRLQALTADTNTISDNVQHLRSSIASMKRAVNEENTPSLPEPSHPSVIMAQLTSATAPARASSSRLRSVATSGTRNVGGQICEDLSIAGFGRFEEIVDFFQTTEKINPPIGIRSWSIAAENPPGAYSFQMQMSYVKGESMPLDATRMDTQWIAQAETEAATQNPVVARSASTSRKRAAKPITVDAIPGSSARIEGILINNREEAAMIDGRMVKPGTMVGEHKFIGLDNNNARFMGGDGRIFHVAWSARSR